MPKYIPRNNAGPYNSITTAALMPDKEYMSYQDRIRSVKSCEVGIMDNRLVPVKVLNKKSTSCTDIDGYFEGYDHKGNCPNCNQLVWRSEHNYCNNCGQALKWE